MAAIFDIQQVKMKSTEKIMNDKRMVKKQV